MPSALTSGLLRSALPRLAALGAMLWVAGCGMSSEPKFVPSESTTRLDKPAQKAIDVELRKNFGEPTRLVVWEKLPVDFGAFEGVIEESPQSFSGPFKVKLARQTASKVPLAEEDLRGAGLIWKSGSNADATAWTKGRDSH